MFQRWLNRCWRHPKFECFFTSWSAITSLDTPLGQKLLCFSPFRYKWRRVSKLFCNSCSLCARWNLCTALFLRTASDILAKCSSFRFWNQLVRPETFCTCRQCHPLDSRILLCPHSFPYLLLLPRLLLFSRPATALFFLLQNTKMK